MSEKGNDVEDGNMLRDDDQSHFNPELYGGDSHPSDDDMMTPPMYNSDDESGDTMLDNTLFANFSKDRVERTVSEWCSCGQCNTMTTERECVCCCESYVIQPLKASFNCVTEVDSFNFIVLNEEGLKYSRYLYSMSMTDDEKRLNYLNATLTPKKMRFLAYKSFINFMSSQDFNRKVRYVLPACVVTAIRRKFPNTDGAPFTGFVCLGTDDGQILP